MRSVGRATKWFLEWKVACALAVRQREPALPAAAGRSSPAARLPRRSLCRRCTVAVGTRSNELVTEWPDKGKGSKSLPFVLTPAFSSLLPPLPPPAMAFAVSIALLSSTKARFRGSGA